MARLDDPDTVPGGRRSTEMGGWAPARNQAVASVEVDGEAVLVDVDTWSLHVLDPIASVVYGCLDGSATIDELIGDLADEFRADPGRVRSDVFDLIADLERRGLLEDRVPARADDRAAAPDPPADAPSRQGRPRFLERPGST